jgi:hypothetical protein
MMNKLASAMLLSLLVFAPLSYADVKGSVSDLGWMTGSWSAPLGPMTLEENWIEPIDGSIASLVRISGEGKTATIELIVIENKGETLELHIQQWDPGYKPRAPAQTMKLIDLGENSVGFEAITPGGMKKLAYSSPAPGQFNIDIVTADDKPIQLTLTAK